MTVLVPTLRACVLAVLALAASAAAAPAQAAVIPFADCIVRETAGYRAYFGYHNTGAANVFLPNGPNNYFSPDPNGDYFGQPINFAPGEHRRAFSLLIPHGQDTSWFLQGSSALIAPATPACGPTWSGAWDDARTYTHGEMVESGGSSWISVVTAATDAPSATSSSWDLVAGRGDDGDEGAEGPEGPSAFDVWTGLGNAGTPADFLASLRGPTGLTGASGSSGAVGVTGPSGASGPAGPSGPAAGPAPAPARSLRFPKSGVMTVQDASVTPSSFVLVQYADPKASPARATNVVSTGAGRFRVRGAAGVRFRYAVR